MARFAVMATASLVLLMAALAGSYPTPPAPPADKGVAPPSPGAAKFPFAEENNEDEEEVFLGELLAAEYAAKLFGLPNNNSGTLVGGWRSDSGMNPEELGEYVEGDILFPSSRSGIRKMSKRWPKGIIPYRIAPKFKRAEKRNITNAMNKFQELTCLQFVPYTGNQTDYLEITNDHTGCWSAVGRTGGQQKVNLQSPACIEFLGVIMHELMHAVGFLHEQNRWERDKYITVNYENIQTGLERNFRLVPQQNIIDFGVPYDYGSVMHYSSLAFSKNKQPTITPKSTGAEDMGQRKGFSQGDIKKIAGMYEKLCKRRESTTKKP